MKKQSGKFISLLFSVGIMPSIFSQTVKRDYAITFFSYFGTNHIFAPKTINKYALNLLYSHSKGTEHFEIGGLVNRSGGSVRYFQAAGLVNLVKDSVTGVQLAGMFNLVNKDVKGFQSAGVFNHSLSCNGLQAAGVYNLNQQQVVGAQLGGVFNLTDSLKGIQVAGLYNHANSVDGVQLSGLVNKAKRVKGMQIGIINISDSCEGIPIGFINYVKHGYHKMELSTNELGFINLGYRLGVKQFHTAFFAGVNPFARTFIWTLGYGIGSSMPVKGNWHATYEVSTQGLLRSTITNFRIAQLHKALIALEYVRPKEFSIAIGPTFNVLVNDLTSTNYASSINAIVPYTLYKHTDSIEKWQTKIWVGASLSLKLF
jgi:hypothetical protein